MDPEFEEEEHHSTSLRVARWVVLLLIIITLAALSMLLLFSNQIGDYIPHPASEDDTTSDATAATSTAATSTSDIATSSAPAFSLQPTTLTFKDGKSITLDVPAGYAMDIAAQGFKSARFMAWSPDHRLFLGEMDGAGDTQTGRVLILDQFDPLSGSFKKVTTYMSDLRNPNSVAFYTDPSGQSWIYIALTDKLVRYQYSPGDDAASGTPQTIATFPDFGPPASEGGWHLTRTLAFDGDTLYVSVGSGCNSCEEPGFTRADILSMNPDGSGNSVYASGLRNAVGLAVVDGSLYATANEADHLGDDKPDDLVYQIAHNANYGWPYCYEFNGVIYADSSQKWKTPFDCTRVPLAYTELDPHSAPLGIAHFSSSFADPALQNSFLVAEHGSGKKSIGTGYMISRVEQGSWTPFISGFLASTTRQGRPVDILQDDDRSFFISDDENGAVYFVRYTQD